MRYVWAAIAVLFTQLFAGAGAQNASAQEAKGVVLCLAACSKSDNGCQDRCVPSGVGTGSRRQNDEVRERLPGHGRDAIAAERRGLADAFHPGNPFGCEAFGVPSDSPWLSVSVRALFAGDHGAGEIFAMDEACEKDAEDVKHDESERDIGERGMRLADCASDYRARGRGLGRQAGV